MYYKSGINNAGGKDVLPLTSEDIGAYKKHKYTQPMPGAKKEDVLQWVKSLLNESYYYKKYMHTRWYQSALDYYIQPSFDDKAMVGANPGLNVGQDTDTIVPPLVKKFVDLFAFWQVKEIYKVDPFVQFVSYAIDNPELKTAQKLLERKYQGDMEKFGARERACDAFVDLALYGNAVLKAEFTQERILVECCNELNVEYAGDEEEGSYLEQLMTADEEVSEQDELVTVTAGDPQLQFNIVDQYAEFSPVFLGHHFMDPFAPGRDWRRAGYMADIQWMSAEDIFDKFKEVRGFQEQFHSLVRAAGSMENNIAEMPWGIGSDPFCKSWFHFIDDNRGPGITVEGRKLYPVTFMFTPKTETVVISDSFVVYHKAHNAAVAKSGMSWHPYIMLKWPGTSNSTYGLGLGHFLRNLQQEQIIIASQRMQMLDILPNVYMEYVEGQVLPEYIESIKNIIAVPVEQMGSIRVTTPAAGAEMAFLNAEDRNFARARTYAGIPEMLEGTSKTHLGAIDKRMDASQVQFDVILERTRDAFKVLHNKMHLMSMAYLEGDLPVYGSISNQGDELAGVLTQDQLDILRNATETVMQLNAGYDVQADMFKALGNLFNTALAQQIVGQLPPDNQFKVFSEMMGMLPGLESLSPLFDPTMFPPPAPPSAAPGQLPPEQGMGGGAPIPPEIPQGGGMPPQAPPQAMPPGMI